MLQSFNDRLKGPFTWIIIISISFIFVISGMTFFFTNIGSSRSYVAKVGDNEIGLQQFQQYAQNATTESQKRAVLDQMINQYLILADAQRHNIVVSKLALQSAIFTNPMFFDKDGKFSADKLKQVVEYIGGMNRLEQILSQNIQATMIPKTIADTVITTDYEKKQLASIYLVNKKIEYLKLSPVDFQSQVKPSQQDLESYYNAHKNDYINPAQKNISYFIISKEDFVSKNNINNDELQEYYETHRELFKDFDNNTKASIQKIIQNRRALEQFNNYSQNIDSVKFAELEKTLGKAKTASIVNNDESTISALTNAQFFVDNDKYSSIPLANNELLVYQVDKSQQASQQKLADVKDKVSKAFVAQKSQQLAIEKSQKLLDDLVSNKKVSISFKQATVDSNSKLFNKEFNDYVMFNTNNQYHSYQADNGDIYIYKVTKVEPLDSKNAKLPSQVLNATKEEELNFYLQVVKQEVPVKVNYKNI
ncbi:SurA N-terminal domain-containing protein [Francisella philomiragia]|uniref:SurA N-terminal domain-containing protein n=1 Tax=Francisella philomiragia TaxID=28110 RepID=UPI0019054185|nr:SurA N-terminal domain-containing protein [Francisella philomiragia]MBK2266784.1 SurA N-terminal domain-containing protein [Francisella philomiragia]MBK2278048.1 SurA N-terminal domain-containing protein [Francisella philomiragia]MBK2285905.1 SurA N-terminal domain-containing protein [Francisella philomiragia]MBK2288067.1 SurA N-terminal domain-containing protein [Francisella philomiragia]MBK2289863.1 SurA N-terminal domain-containing protein [Francisella philomiragia]